MGLPVAFFRWSGKSSFFNGATRFSSWIEGFQPGGSDMLFERSKPSCFASTPFCEVMSQGDSSLILAGFAGESACLSTAIDAFHRGHNFTFLSDASASHDLEGATSTEVHDIVSKVVGVYGEVMSTRSWIATTAKRTRWAEHEAIGRH
jgi:nicotinamidase-related amidase